jgi:hypothetical protein
MAIIRSGIKLADTSLKSQAKRRLRLILYDGGIQIPKGRGSEGKA